MIQCLDKKKFFITILSNRWCPFYCEETKKKEHKLGEKSLEKYETNNSNIF